MERSRSHVIKAIAPPEQSSSNVDAPVIEDAPTKSGTASGTALMCDFNVYFYRCRDLQEGFIVSINDFWDIVERETSGERRQKILLRRLQPLNRSW